MSELGSDPGSDDPRAALAEMRALAEEGRDAPLINGFMYVLWGGLLGTAALIVFAAEMGWFHLFGNVSGFVPWLVAIGAGWILSMIYGPKTARKRGASTVGNRTAQAVWFAVGLFMTGFWLTLMVVHDNFTALGVPPYFLFSLMFPLFFGLYGVAMFATATAARVEWLRWVAFVSWGCSAASLSLIGSPYQTLVAGLGSLAAALGPGLILMRGESKDTR